MNITPVILEGLGTGAPNSNHSIFDLIGEVLQKGQVSRTRNRRACKTRCMTVYEAKRICKDRSMQRSVVSATPIGGKT